jgi:penicillin-binding protein 1A
LSAGWSGGILACPGVSALAFATWQVPIAFTAPSPRSEAVEPPTPRRPARRWRLLRWAIILAIWGVLAFGGMLLWFARDLPRPEAALDAARRPALVLRDRTGRDFASFGDVVGDPLRLSDMPAALPEAAVAVEDRRFWQHHGIDGVGIMRALWVDITRLRLAQGGSTITQQVAKNLFLTNARTLRRKVQEVMLTLWLERSFTKAEILEIWLNRVYLGSGAWGVDGAARLYFGVSARQVSLWQAAMLAGIPRAPSRFNPRTDPAAAIARTKEVLAAMVDTGAITQAAADRAISQINLPKPPSNAGWFADWAAEQVAPDLPPGADAKLQTTLDSHLQAVAEQRLAALLDGPGVAAQVGQGAVVVLDAATGAVRAMAGGRDYHRSPYNRAVVARRQPGSAFKPFVWLADLQAGDRPDSLVQDSPVRVGNWSPADFEGHYLGEITIERALAVSSNTAAVRLLLRAGGPATVAAVAHRLGITDRLPADASMALGTGEVGLLELCAAYAGFFNGGLLVTPYGVTGIAADGRPVPATIVPPRRVMEPDHAAMMARMLAAVVANGSGRAAGLPGRVVAGKTGTTQDSRDAWFVGWTNGVIIGVWLGNDDDQPMRNVTGGSLPARLFHDIAAAVP